MDNSLQNEAKALLGRLPLSDPLTQNIPAELTALHGWVAYAAQERDGRVTKPPLDPKLDSPRFASVDKPESWGTFGEAMGFLCAHRGEGFKANGRLAVVAGVGRVLTAKDGVTGTDIDHCLDPATGAVLPWAKPLVDAMQAAGFYLERSPSGTGLRGFCREPLPPECGDGFRGNGVEVYRGGKRFLTVTGHAFGSRGTLRTLPEGQDCRKALLSLWRHARPEQPKAQAPQRPSMPAPLSPEQRFSAMFGGDGGARRKALFDNPAEDIDPSSPDMSLANAIVQYFGPDPALCEWAMNQSGRRRGKWEETGHYPDRSLTYLQGTIQKALDTFKGTFWEDECRQRQGQRRQAGGSNASTGKRKAQAQAQAFQTAGEREQDASPAVVLASEMPPLDMLHPSIQATLADVAEVNSTGMEVAFASFLSFMGTIIAGRASVAMLEEGAVHLNLYLVLEAQSGSAKSGAQKFFYAKPFALLRASETEYAKAKEKYDRDMEAWNLLPESVRQTAKDEDKPKKPRKRKTDLIRGNLTLEGALRRCASNPNGVGVIVDELAQLLGGLDAYSKGGQKQTKDFLLSAYEGDVYSNARKAEVDELSAACCLVSIFGATQPEKLAELYTLSDLFTGFLSRFVFISYEQKDAQTLCSRRYREESRRTVESMYSVFRNGLIETKADEKEGTPIPTEIPIDEDARAVFIDWVNSQHRKEWDLGHYTGPVNKLSVQMTKIIGLIHIANIAAVNGTSIGSITKEEVLACLPLWDWLYGNFLSVMERLYAKASGRKRVLTLNGRDREVLAAIVRNVRLEGGQSLTATAKDIAAWLEKDGRKVPANAVAFAMKKLLAPGEIVLSSNPSRRPNQYRLTGATLARLQATSLMLDASGGD